MTSPGQRAFVLDISECLSVFLDWVVAGASVGVEPAMRPRNEVGQCTTGNAFTHVASYGEANSSMRTSAFAKM